MTRGSSRQAHQTSTRGIVIGSFGGTVRYEWTCHTCDDLKVNTTDVIALIELNRLHLLDPMFPPDVEPGEIIPIKVGGDMNWLPRDVVEVVIATVVTICGLFLVSYIVWAFIHVTWQQAAVVLAGIALIGGFWSLVAWRAYRR